MVLSLFDMALRKRSFGVNDSVIARMSNKYGALAMFAQVLFYLEVGKWKCSVRQRISVRLLFGINVLDVNNAVE